MARRFGWRRAVARFLPGHPKIPGSGRRKGQTKKKAGVPEVGTIREFLTAKQWNPLAEVHELMPKLTSYQQARINMEVVAMEQKERLGPQPETPPAGESEEAKRTAVMGAAEFVASLPVKLNGSNGNGAHPGAG